MKMTLGQYMRGFKDSTPQPTAKPESPKLSKSWSQIPVRMWVDSVSAESQKVLLVAFSPRLCFVTKELANEILAKYQGFKRIKFLPRRFLPAAVEEKINVPIECIIGR